MVQGEYVRARQIRNMYIVANTSAIRRIVIVSENIKAACFACCGHHGARNNMSFGVVLFAQFTIWIGTTGVKVAQRRIRYTVGSRIIG